MKKIVIITNKGNVKRDFANVLANETSGSVVLVLLQRPTKRTFWRRVHFFILKVGILAIPIEIICLLRLHFSHRKKEILSWMKARSPLSKTFKYFTPPVREIDDINSQEVFEILNKIKPDIITIWGGSIVKSHIFKTAKIAVNIHSGVAPYYRGVVGHAMAILNNDWNHLGTTIHYVIDRVDAGNIIKVIKANYRQSPQACFRELNDKSFWAYVDVVKKLAKGNKLPFVSQNRSIGHQYRLKEWTYCCKNHLVKKLLDWNRRYSNK